MTLCGALFIMYLGYFQGEKRIMTLGAILVVVSISIMNPWILEAIGIDPEQLGLAASGDNG